MNDRPAGSRHKTQDSARTEDWVGLQILAIGYYNLDVDLRGLDHLHRQQLVQDLEVKCINCGKESEKGVMSFGFFVCQECEDTGNQMAAMLEKGISLELLDDTGKIYTETLRPAKK